MTPIEAPPGGPNVVGATGGSGTRVVARVLARSGMYIGRNLNRADDALPFAEYSDTWINRYLTAPAEAEPGMRAALERLLADHLAGRKRRQERWGWKEPRSIYLVPFLHEAMPALRFLHVVRDGRDMAFSGNQFQPAKHGDAALGETAYATEQERAIALWAQVNERAADYGERVLGSAYARLRFEDLCAEPERRVAEALAFVGLDGDAAKLARKEVEPPSSLGRYRSEDPALVERLEAIAGAALARFGYA
jgi:hypothetical protein